MATHPPSRKLASDPQIPYCDSVQPEPIQPDKTKVLFTLRELGAAVLALLSIFGSYFAMKTAIASAEEKVTTAAVTVASVEKQVNSHETRLALVDKQTALFKEDLDRRFNEVKEAQRDSERRILDAMRELKAEIRKR